MNFKVILSGDNMNEALVYQAHYTKSDPILNYMTGMLDLHPHDSILEPCGGDGVFVDKILEKVPNANISVFELNPQAVIGLKNKYNGEANIQIKETDTLLDDSITTCTQICTQKKVTLFFSMLAHVVLTRMEN